MCPCKTIEVAERRPSPAVSSLAYHGPLGISDILPGDYDRLFLEDSSYVLVHC